MTWNTQWRFGDWQPRQALLRSTLAAQRPDVVLLQETWPEQAADLAEACGLDVLGFGGGYFDQTLSDVPVDHRFGNAVLGSLAGDGPAAVDAPFASPGDPAPRHLIGFEVGGVVVASVHLCHLWDRPEIRADQLREIVPLLQGLGRPFVVAGDFNMVPSSDEYRVALDFGLIDGWDLAFPGVHGPTMVPANPEINFTAWMNDRNGDAAPLDTGVRLDYLFSSRAAMIQSVERFGVMEGPRWPSDHLGLVAELGI